MQILLLLIGVVLIGVVVVALMSFFGSRRSRTAERLSTIGRYGFEAEPGPAMLPQEPGANVLELVMTKLGGLVSSRFGELGEDEMRAELMSAGMYRVSPRTMLGYRTIAPVVLPILAFLLLGASSSLDLALIVVMVPAGWSLPLVFVKRKARFRLAEIDRSLPDLIDLLCVMVEAGLGFGASLRLAADQQTGPLSDELRLTLQEQTMGLGVDEALGNLARRCKTPAMNGFVRAMAQGERMGISTGQIMRGLSHEMRQRRRAAAEERAQKAPVKMLVPLVFLIFPSIFIFLMTPAVISLMHSLSF